jgi:hypothetical protein
LPLVVSTAQSTPEKDAAPLSAISCRRHSCLWSEGWGVCGAREGLGQRGGDVAPETLVDVETQGRVGP